MADEKYLEGNPVWGQGEWQGTGGGTKAQEFYAFKDFAKIFGRNPTQQELSMFAPAYGTDDPNKTNQAAGASVIAQYYQNQQNTPDKLFSKQQAEYKKNAPQQYDTVKKMFQGQLGRDASQEELDHFGSLLASGTTDAYQLQDFLKQQPEYQTRQNEQMRQGLSGQMATNDKRQFQEQILPSIQENFAKQGRSFDSSAFANAATQSAQQQNTQREGFLNNLTAQQYGGVQDRAYQDYANQVANQQNLTNQGIQAKYGSIQGTQGRINQISDYNMQAQAYNQYLAKYGKRGGLAGLGGALGGAVGGGLGAVFGGPQGAMAGYQIGSGLGNASQGAIQGGNY